MCCVGKIGRCFLSANFAGRFKDVGCRLWIEVSDRTLAGTGPHSTLRLPDWANNLGMTIATITVLIAILDFLTFSQGNKKPLHHCQRQSCSGLCYSSDQLRDQRSIDHGFWHGNQLNLTIVFGRKQHALAHFATHLAGLQVTNDDDFLTNQVFWFWIPLCDSR